MFNSILHFQQEGTKRLTKIFEEYGKDFTKLAEMVYGVTEDAVARILEEAVDSTYRKGGANASISGSAMSKETVMNKLHALKFPQTLHQGEKKVIETLYIDADEDHVALQYFSIALQFDNNYDDST